MSFQDSLKVPNQSTRGCLNEHGLPLEFNRPNNIVQRLGEKRAAEIKAEIVRIGLNGTRQGRKFAARMFERYPELREL
jgi:hypothetical protein